MYLGLLVFKVDVYIDWTRDGKSIQCKIEEFRCSYQIFIDVSEGDGVRTGYDNQVGFTFSGMESCNNNDVSAVAEKIDAEVQLIGTVYPTTKQRC